jgi:hypothetical protein
MKHMTIAKFRALGYVQEVNRRLLHPIGLALEVTIAEDGSESIGTIWDCRDDPEGIRYVGIEMEERAHAFDQEWHRRFPARDLALGYMVQPARDVKENIE